jgi:Raf kinase inhibitor-like YbhB/YbcL family protein
LRSSAFADGGVIPTVHTCQGKGVSPPLQWSGVPESARSLALICEDPNTPRGIFVHWLLYNAAPGLKGLPEDVAAEERANVGTEGDVVQGLNDFGKVGYGGPCPPDGKHRYIFRLYALDSMLELGPKAKREQLIDAMKGHIIGTGRMTGRYPG